MADIKLLCEELNKLGIQCSIVKEDDRACDELTFAHDGFERISGNKPVELSDSKIIIRNSGMEICDFYNINFPIIRGNVHEIAEKETEIAENIFDIFERHAGNRGLKIKAPGSSL